MAEFLADYPEAIPAEWTGLTQIKPLAQEKMGAQMDGGWFAVHDQFGPVFIKQFKANQTQEAGAEIAIFAQLASGAHETVTHAHTVHSSCDGRHENVATPLMHRYHNGCVVLMQEKLCGGDLFKHIFNHYADSDCAYSEEEVSKIIGWLAQGVQFLHRHGVAQ